MDESALERYFDKFIANDSSKMEEAEEEEYVIDEFCSLLPEELLTMYKDDTCKTTQQKAKSDSRTGFAESSTRLVHRSQNPTAPGIHQPQIIPQINNIVSTVKLGCSLDLHFIARNAWNVEYKPKTFKALIMRIREPRITAVIYQTGNIVFSGAKSEEQSRRGGRKCARKLQKLGFPVRFLNFKILNLQASCDTFPIHLEQLARHQLCSYEPELFPGLFYSGVPGVSALIFATGKVSFIGAKREGEIYNVLDAIVPILSRYRRL